MASGTRFKRFVLNPWTALIVLVIAGGALAFVVRNQEDTEQAAPPQQRPPAPVQVERVRGVTLTETVRAVGTLRAIETVEIRPEIAGRIRTIHFTDGGSIEQGQLLFQIDDQKLQYEQAAREAALRAQQARVANAERTLRRQEQLHERNAASLDDLDRARIERDVALAEQERTEAELALIRRRIEDTRIIAPFGGQISERRADRGAYVAVADHLATLYRTDPVEIGISIPERYSGQVRMGQPVEVFVASHPGEVFECAIDFISPVVDERTRTFRVRARIPNREGLLKPGSFATAQVAVEVRENRPVVSAESLVATRHGYIVFIVEEERVRSQQVRTGLRRDSTVEIVEGLTIGETVVRTGHLRLRGGERVAVIDGNGEGAALADRGKQPEDVGGEDSNAPEVAER